MFQKRKNNAKLITTTTTVNDMIVEGQDSIQETKNKVIE